MRSAGCTDIYFTRHISYNLIGFFNVTMEYIIYRLSLFFVEGVFVSSGWGGVRRKLGFPKDIAKIRKLYFIVRETELDLPLLGNTLTSNYHPDITLLFK